MHLLVLYIGWHYPLNCTKGLGELSLKNSDNIYLSEQYPDVLWPHRGNSTNHLPLLQKQTKNTRHLNQILIYTAAKNSPKQLVEGPECRSVRLDVVLTRLTAESRQLWGKTAVKVTHSTKMKAQNLSKSQTCCAKKNKKKLSHDTIMSERPL